MRHLEPRLSRYTARPPITLTRIRCPARPAAIVRSQNTGLIEARASLTLSLARKMHLLIFDAAHSRSTKTLFPQVPLPSMLIAMPLSCISDDRGHHPQEMFQEISRLIAELRLQPPFEMNVESYRRRAALDRKRGPGPPTNACDNQGKS
jgi:hypothetical protein